MRRTLRLAVRELGIFFAVQWALSGRRPRVPAMARSFAFYVATFTAVRLMSCGASALFLAHPRLQRPGIVKSVVPAWLGLSMLLLGIETRRRQRQIAVRAAAAPPGAAP